MKRMILLLACLLALCASAWANTTGVNYGRGPMYDARFWRYPTGLGLRWMDQVENILALNIRLGTGHIFYVDSGVSNAGDGSSWSNAKATLDEAVDLCVANRGDVILVAQGHNEAVGTGADAVDIDMAGVTVIGLGTGSLKPTFDYDDYDTGTFAIGAANVTIVNLRFRASVTDINEAIAVEAGGDYFTCLHCDFGFAETAGDEFKGAAIAFAAGADYGTVDDCYFNSGLQAAVCAVKLSGACIGTTIRDCLMYGDYSTANINGVTAASTYVNILNNILWNGGTNDIGTEPVIEMYTGSSATIAGNFCVCNLATKAAAIVCDKAMLFGNYYNEDLSSAGTGGLIGTESADDGG
jgi:hypothetical protein